MPDIHIRRDHALGLERARQLAWQWAESVEEKFGMSCTVVEGETSDVVEFTRAGVDGRLAVEAGAFELTARLGFLLGAFRQRIEAEIESRLDDLLAAAPPAPRAVRASPAPKAAKAPRASSAPASKRTSAPRKPG